MQKSIPIEKSVVEPLPQGAKTFGQNRSRYIEVSAPAPGQIKVVNKNHSSY
jgi:hypothetical protein